MPRLTNVDGVTVSVDDETAKRLLGSSAGWSASEAAKPAAKKVAAPKSEAK